MKKLLIITMLAALCSACTPTHPANDQATTVGTTMVDTTVVDTTVVE